VISSSFTSKISLLTISDVSNTNELLSSLNSLYPQLKEMKFTISVNRRIVNNNEPLNADSEVALLPPFSGG